MVLPTDAAYVKCPPLADITYGIECEVGGTGEGPIAGVLDFGDGTTYNVELEGMCYKSIDE